MKQLIDELEEELLQEKLAAGIQPTLKSELYLQIPPPLSEEAKRIRKENAERSRWEMRWMLADKKAKREAAKAAAEGAAEYLP